MSIKSHQKLINNYICDLCDYTSCNKYYYNKHLLTAKHIKLTKTLIATTNSRITTTNDFTCEKCNYTTSKKSDYNKHLLTAKHKQLIQNYTTTNCIECNICNKKYNSRAGLWLHKKKCSFESCIEVKEIQNNNSTLIETINEKNVSNNSLIMNIIKENQEFKNMLLEQCKQAEIQQKQMFKLQEENNTIMNKMVEISQQQMTISSNVTNNNNIVNNQFNLNLFLNETCKNAINFSEFIDNIQVSTSDLENNAKMGFVNGISKLILDNLKQLELSERPIHCTDSKRETIYVKEEDEWDKKKSHEVIQKGIQEITCKNMCQLSEWRVENPEYADIESELGEKSIVMQQNSMAGGKRDEFYPKIIKNIAKESMIDKKKLLE